MTASRRLIANSSSIGSRQTAALGNAPLGEILRPFPAVFFQRFKGFVEWTVAKPLSVGDNQGDMAPNDFNAAARPTNSGPPTRPPDAVREGDYLVVRLRGEVAARLYPVQPAGGGPGSVDSS